MIQPHPLIWIGYFIVMFQQMMPKVLNRNISFSTTLGSDWPFCPLKGEKINFLVTLGIELETCCI